MNPNTLIASLYIKKERVSRKYKMELRLTGQVSAVFTRVFRRRGTPTLRAVRMLAGTLLRGNGPHHDLEDSLCSGHQAILGLPIPAEEFPQALRGWALDSN